MRCGRISGEPATPTRASCSFLRWCRSAYVDEARLSGFWLWLARHGVPIAAILMPAGFFLSVVSPDATKPSALIALVPIGGLFLVGGVLALGIGLLRGADVAADMDPVAR